MSAVDVLAVLDAVERAAKSNVVPLLGTTKGVDAMAQLIEIREARAAVAELVEAAKDAMDCDTIQAWSATKGERRQELLARYECAPGMRPVNETKARLRAALARLQGGAK